MAPPPPETRDPWAPNMVYRPRRPAAAPQTLCERYVEQQVVTFFRHYIMRLNRKDMLNSLCHPGSFWLRDPSEILKSIQDAGLREAECSESLSESTLVQEQKSLFKTFLTRSSSKRTPF